MRSSTQDAVELERLRGAVEEMRGRVRVAEAALGEERGRRERAEERCKRVEMAMEAMVRGGVVVGGGGGVVGCVVVEVRVAVRVIAEAYHYKH